MTRSLSDEQKESLLNQIPIGKLGDVSDIANAVLFLASDLSKYITGSTLHVNGGMLMD
jgi:3-oxoacyl-[acyl-carrier protein] reductase